MIKEDSNQIQINQEEEKQQQLQQANHIQQQQQQQQLQQQQQQQQILAQNQQLQQQIQFQQSNNMNRTNSMSEKCKYFNIFFCSVLVRAYFDQPILFLSKIRNFLIILKKKIDFF